MVVDDGKESPLLTQRDIAVVLTERINIQGMRVRDMVGLGRSPYTGFFGVLRDRDNEIVTEAMKLAGLPPEQYAHRLINEISDGEKQKAMIAKAIAQQTPVILLDEPTAFLDYPSKEETMLMLRSLAHEQGKAILISTHDLDVAQRTTDAAWFFSNGAIEELSDPSSMTKIFR
jgi:iron complex transport system ATP-binding protein